MGKRRFWGTVQGVLYGRTSTEIGRGGSDGVEGHLRGWDFGIHVRGYINEAGNDEFEIWTTGGSNKTSKQRCIGRFNQFSFEIEKPYRV